MKGTLFTNPIPYISWSDNFKLYTEDEERFAGLNIRGFSTIEIFVEIFSRCLGHKYSLFRIIKERHLYSRKTFCNTLKNREKHESLAQRFFPRLRYILHCVIMFNQTDAISYKPSRWDRPSKNSITTGHSIS